MFCPLFLEPYRLEKKECGIQMRDMCKVKKVIERRKYKALKRGGFYAKYKLNHK